MKLLLLITFLFSAVSVWSQGQCFTEAEAQKIIESVNSPTLVKPNESLRQELLKMADERQKLSARIAENVEQNRSLIPEMNQMGERFLLRVCQIVKENGWLTKTVVQEDGFNAFINLIINNKAFQMQKEFLPVLIEGAKKDYLKKYVLASVVDNIRVGLGAPQIFGTQATIREGVLYLYPLLNEQKVNEWRAEYDLPNLIFGIKELEGRYVMPLLKLKYLPPPPILNQKTAENNKDTALLGIINEETETVKVETNLVNLNIRILTQDFKTPKESNFSKEDFVVLENGQEQEISFFSASEQPFNLVLVLDFSGSTKSKQDIIKKAAQKFVDYSRANDQISVVAFANQIKLVSELTTDKQKLKKQIKNIDIGGGSPIWDSISFTYKNILQTEKGKRNAVVIMTDGEDGSFNTSFADLFETVRNSDTTIFPVYFTPFRELNEITKKLNHKSYQSLWMLAEETGGQLYKADKFEDLEGIYEQVVNELGKIYSIGYEPKNTIRDGAWRNLKVKIKSRTDVIARTRRGYYAN